MHDQPSVSELVQAVKTFIDESAAPALTGRAAFHARVASNVLATVLRDLDQRPGADQAERSRLLELLGASGDRSTEELNRDLCALIQSGDMTPETPGLLAHLKATMIDQVEIDQPRYSGLKAAKD